jgi:hypothetical protein
MSLASSPAASASAAANQMVEMCASEGDRAACYESAVPTLYPEHATAFVFDVIRAIRTKDPDYQFCHVLAHKLGERVVAEDPSNWLDAIPLNPPDGMCSNGFIHGVVGGKFRAEVLDAATIESLIPDFSVACEDRPTWRPSDLDKAICYHGMGHLYDFITDADLEKALGLCARTAGKIFQRVCIEGVFMQIFQPLEPDDFALIARMPLTPTRQNVREFCASYGKDEFVGACLRESWPLFSREVLTGTGVGGFCSGQPNQAETEKCFEGAAAIVGRTSLGDARSAIEACGAFPSQGRNICFASIAQAALEEDRDAVEHAIALCEASDETSASCLASLAERAGFLYGEDTARKARFCGALPSDMMRLCR